MNATARETTVEGGRPTTKDTRYNGTQLGDEGERARGTREKIHRIDARTETERSATKEEELTDRGSFFYLSYL